MTLGSPALIAARYLADHPLEPKVTTAELDAAVGEARAVRAGRPRRREGR